MRRLVPLAALLAVGCAPDLGPDYRCARSQCPPTWTCWADDVCRREAPESLLGDHCDASDTCDTRLCAEGLDPGARDEGKVCTLPCDDDDDCMGFPDPPGVRCVQGACRVACANDTDCPDETECYFGLPEPGNDLPSGPTCFHLGNTRLDGARSCTGNGAGGGSACQLPGWCVQLDGGMDELGLCSMICETRMEAMQCPGMSRCVEIVPMLGQCMVPCTVEMGCNDPSLECLADGRGELYCMPASWAGRLPLATGNLDTLVRLPPPGGP